MPHMSHSQVKIGFAMFAVAVLGVSTLIKAGSNGFIYTVRTASSFPILTEQGTPISSVFSGAMPNRHMKESLMNPWPHRRFCEGGRNGMLTQVKSWLQLKSVRAFTCGPEGTCGAHYTVMKGQSCGFACGNANFPLNDSEHAGYCDGWKFTGNDACFSCNCEMDWCASC
jgi:hypothetical protein